MYPLGPGGNPGPPHHQRTFLAAETQEVRLYGQGGADVFVLDGRSQRGPLVRVVGGAGRAGLVNRSWVHGRGRKTKVYDVPGGMAVARSPEAATRFSRQPAVNQYNRTAFQYPYLASPYPWSYNVDDGLFIGLGLILKQPGFRKVPWASTPAPTVTWPWPRALSTFAAKDYSPA